MDSSSVPTVARLFRAHIRPRVADPAPTLDYCLNHGLIGIGWGAGGFDNLSPTVEEYRAAYNGKLDPSVACFMQLHMDDLVWFRDRKGIYYLARVTGDWRSWNAEVARALDLRNVRDAEIVTAGSEESIPGKVIAAFTAGRTFRAIHSDTALDYSRTLFNERCGRVHYPPSSQSHDLFDLVNAEDLEDLVLIYLQTLGWIYVPSSRKRSTLRYEAMLMHVSDGSRGFPQVKSGNTRLRPADYAGNEQVFLFAGGGFEGGESPPNVTLIQRNALLDFCRDRSDLMPDRIRRHYHATLAHRVP